MTTIVYKEGIIAYDSLAIQDEVIRDGDFDKKILSNGNIYFICGAPCDFEKFERAYMNDEKVEKCNISALVIESGVLYEASFDHDDGFWKDKVLKPMAIGSGQKHALTAMDLGCTAKEAVKMAMKRDTGTGGRVRTYKLRIE